MIINEQHERFCQEYVIDLNATAAAIRAGYAKNSAKVQASRLLTKANIKERISQLQNNIAIKLEITAESVANELASIAFSKVTDFVKVEDIEVGKGKRKKIIRAVLVEKTSDIPKELLPAISEIKQTQFGISLKLHDKTSALELLGKHIGFFTKDNEERQQTIIINGTPISQK